ncbi:MAG TPA: superoxide dismutase family protein [Gaiellaceae bacterium]|nr:superoxide dismutase family protein [Gaiellaceae bacterium]
MPYRLRSRKTALLVALALAAAILTAPLYASGGDGRNSARKSVKVQLVDASGAAAGIVKLTQQGSSVTARAEVEGLTPGFHGFHVHSVGECVAPFTSAGGHYNPTGAGHGSHAGDMPSLLVLDDGTASLQFATDNFTIAELFDADGTAIIVHALPDNFANIPTRYQSTTEGTLGPDSATLATGDAGGRVACGVVGSG